MGADGYCLVYSLGSERYFVALPSLTVDHAVFLSRRVCYGLASLRETELPGIDILIDSLDSSKAISRNGFC